MKTLLIGAILAGASALCAAQSTHMHMPEGSKDIYVSLAMGSAPASDGSKERTVFLVPLLSAQFANGVFIDMNTIGIHLSRDPSMNYGLMLSPSITRVRTRTAQGWDNERKFTPELGAFYSYGIAHGLSVRTSLLYGGDAERRGLALNIGANAYMPVAEHHTVGIDLSARLANRPALQAGFGVTEEQSMPGLPVYTPRGGMRLAVVSGNWNWHFSNKYTFMTRIAYSRLLGSAAASPRVEQAGGVQAYGVLTYRY